MPQLASDLKAPEITPLSARISRLRALLARIVPIDPKWLESHPTGRNGQACLEVLECQNYKELATAWRKALTWTPGLDCGLSVMLTIVASTMAPGEQLWFKILGPPSSGKTTLLEAVATDTEHVYSKDTIKGVHTGDRSAHLDGQDLSLIGMAAGKMFAVKDADTLLKMPNKEQILSEFRGLYDRTSRTHYRNTVMKDYVDKRMTQCWCGTNALREIDQSDLGQRFLDCVVLDEIDDDFEDEVAWRAANQEARNVRMAPTTEKSGGSGHSPELELAMCLSGGYAKWLYVNAYDLVSQLDMEKSEKALRRCTKLGKFVAYMRARPHKDRESEREFCARLVKQFVRLATFLAVVLNKNHLDKEVMQRVVKIALDTSRGLSLKILEQLYATPDGMDNKALSMFTGADHSEMARMVKFLKKIGILERNEVAAEHGAKTKQNHWVLTSKLRKLYREITAKDL